MAEATTGASHALTHKNAQEGRGRAGGMLGLAFGFTRMSALMIWANLLAFGCLAPESRGDRERHRLVVTRPDDSGIVRHHDASAAFEAADEGTHTDDDASAGDAADSGESSPTRTVFYPALRNARDLGGVPLGAGARVAYEVLFRGPPLAFSDEGCDALAQLGIRTVVDLRVASEYEAVPEAPCVAEQARIVHAPLPVPYNVSAADYLTVLHATESIAAALAVLSDPAAYPVYMHCTYGRDRTGVIAAVVLRALGASPDAVMREYMLSAPLVGAYPNSLAAVLDELAANGGIEQYLSRAGMTDEQLAAMRAVLTAAP